MEALIPFQQVKGDSLNTNATEWYDPSLGFIKIDVVAVEDTSRADIHFLEREWSSYQIHPKPKVDQEKMRGIAENQQEVIRMISAALNQIRAKETAEVPAATSLALNVQTEALKAHPIYQ